MIVDFLQEMLVQDLRAASFVLTLINSPLWRGSASTVLAQFGVIGRGQAGHLAVAFLHFQELCLALFGGDGQLQAGGTAED